MIQQERGITLPAVILREYLSINRKNSNHPRHPEEHIWKRRRVSHPSSSWGSASDRRNSFFYNTYQNKNWSGSPINTFGDDSCVNFGDDKERTDRNVCSKLKKLDEEILRFAQNDGGVMRRFFANARDNKKRNENYLCIKIAYCCKFV